MAKVGSKEKIRRFLRQRVGEVVTSQQIRDAVGPDVTEWARRLRELRNDEKWQILTHNDRKDLKPGEYVLKEPPPASYQVSRSISSRLRAQVLDRNGFTCQWCGIGPGELDEEGRKARLHIGHIVDRSLGGKDEISNLQALCSNCNQGSKNITPEPPSWKWLLQHLRRATIADQQQALKWLKQKLGD